jgi:hypothetical protein
MVSPSCTSTAPGWIGSAIAGNATSNSSRQARSGILILLHAHERIDYHVRQ